MSNLYRSSDEKVIAGVCVGKRRRTALTMVVSPDGTCVPCAKKDLGAVSGETARGQGSGNGQ